MANGFGKRLPISAIGKILLILAIVFGVGTFLKNIETILLHPITIPILLIVGFSSLVVEFFTPRFGLPGLISLTAFILFFYGHIATGLTGYIPLILFIAGGILFLLELIVPGGIVGFLGFILMIASLFISTNNPVHMGISIVLAVTISVMIFIFLVKVIGRPMKFFKKLILTDATDTKSGYVSNENRIELIGQEGVTLTPLRPSGTILIGDERIDVVSEGSFIQKDKKVRVVKTEGPRIVVREIEELDHNKHKEV